MRLGSWRSLGTVSWFALAFGPATLRSLARRRLDLFAHALSAYERNRPAEFEVMNTADWNAGLGSRAFRTIQLHPR